MLFHIEQRPNAEAEAKEEEEEEEEEEKEANGEAGSDQNRDPNVNEMMKPKLKSILGAFPLLSILVVTQLFSP